MSSFTVMASALGGLDAGMASFDAGFSGGDSGGGSDSMS